MEEMKRYQIPAFGDWDYCNQFPITQFFESATQYFEEEKDLFQVPVQVIPVNKYNHRCHSTKRQQRQLKKEHKKAPKAVDEDLYKIPAELLYKKTKQKGARRSVWSRCLGLSCMT